MSWEKDHFSFREQGAKGGGGQLLKSLIYKAGLYYAIW